MWPLSALLLTACADVDADAARAAWLVDSLVTENRVWSSRDPELLATKYRRMAADPYDFVRGTAGVFLRDAARPGTDRPQTAFAADPVTAQVLLVGDPHPENFGTFLPLDPPTEAGLDEPLLVELADLDGVAFGPYVLDVRRLGLGLAALLDGAGCDAACRVAPLAAMAEGYAEEIEAWAEVESHLAGKVADGEHGDLVDARLGNSRVEGLLGSRRADLTQSTVSGARLRRDLAVDADGRGMLAPTGEERAQLDRLLAAYPGPEGFRELDAVRRFGTGIASLPAVRYVVLWDRGADGPEDDDLLQLREVVDPAPPPGLLPAMPGLFEDNAERIESSAARLWSRPDADPRLAGLTDGAMSFKAISWSSWFDVFDHEVIAEFLATGEADLGDVEELAELLGRLLADAHARAPTARGELAAPAIAADLADRQDAWIDERVEHAELDLDRARRDHLLFVDALDRLGPLLGADALAVEPDPT